MKRSIIVLVFIGYLIQSSLLDAASAVHAQLSTESAHEQNLGTSQVAGAQQKTSVQFTPMMQGFLPALLKKYEENALLQKASEVRVTEQNLVAVVNAEKLRLWDPIHKVFLDSGMGEDFCAGCSVIDDQHLVVNSGGQALLLVDIARGLSQNFDFPDNGQILSVATASKGTAVVFAGIAPSNNSIVVVRYPDKDVAWTSPVGPISLLTSDGKDTFAIGNFSSNLVVILSREGVHKVTVPELPRVLALDEQHNLYIGTATGNIHVSDSKRQWVSFNSGNKPVQFLAVYSHVVMVVHEGDGLLKVFAREEFLEPSPEEERAPSAPLYSIPLSPSPLRQISVNKKGTIACITKLGKIRVLAIDYEKAGELSAISENQLQLLNDLIEESQNHGYPDPTRSAIKRDLSLIPASFKANLQEIYPPQATNSGQRAMSGQSLTMREKIEFVCKKCFYKTQSFVREHQQLVLGSLASIAYLVLFHRQELRNLSLRCSSRIHKFFRKNSYQLGPLVLRW